MTDDLESIWPQVLAQYGAPLLRWVSLGAAGGFSGASIWRGEAEGVGVLALKAWPPGKMPVERLARIHQQMARAAVLPFVPRAVPALNGSTVVAALGRVWDLTTWMPGTADFHADPSRARLANACSALAEIHRAWRPTTATYAPCPNIQTRLRILAKWRAAQASGSLRMPEGPPRLLVAIERGRLAAAAALDLAERQLREWENRSVFIQTCFCDIWTAHVLFTGDRVTGVIDYGSVRDDNIAVDLARLLGDMIGDDEALFAAGVDAYCAAAGFRDMPRDFVRLLDRTTMVCGVINWLNRLCGREYQHPDMDAVVARLEKLTARVERAFPGSGGMVRESNV